MPELPETETIARDLDGVVRDATIVEVIVHRADVLRECTASTFRKRVRGATLTRFSRRAKCIVAELSTGDRLVITPRFTGALLVEPSALGDGDQPSTYHGRDQVTSPESDADYTTIRFRLADGRSLRYRDVRRLGTVALMASDRFSAWDAALGPEPLDPGLTAERFSGILRASSRAVKTILMDQRRLAGIGNIYANEALWRAGIRPARRGAAVRIAEATSLLTALRAVLVESIALRGTSFRDYRDAFGARGGFVEQLAVYGRGGAPCHRCGTELRATHAIEGRATVYCPACQR